jgi:hypothetical protein
MPMRALARTGTGHLLKGSLAHSHFHSGWPTKAPATKTTMVKNPVPNALRMNSMSSSFRVGL